MIELSHILFEPVILKENFFSRLDNRIKVVFCIIILIINLIIPGNIFQISLLVFYVLIASTWKVRLVYILGRLFVPIFIAGLLMLTRLGELHLALVIVAGVSCISLLSFSTPIEGLLLALRRLKTPQILIEITFLMYKYIFIFFEQTQTIYHAQVSRLGYHKFRNSLRSLAILVGMLIIRSFERAQASYEAILARGYRDELFY